MHFIYGLVDPDTSRVFYVGRSRNPSQRFTSHLSDNGNSDKAQWIRKLASEGKQPSLMILEECMTEVEVVRAERFWITLGEKSGWKLLNNVNAVDLWAHEPELHSARKDKQTKAKRNNQPWGLDLTKVPESVANVFLEFYDPEYNNLARGGRAEAKRVLFGYDFANAGRDATEQARIVEHFFNMWRSQRETKRESAN